MVATVSALLVLLLGALLAARYGSDSRSTAGDPSGRDPAWPDTPARAHTVGADARLVVDRAAACARRAAARARAVFDRSPRPWAASPLDAER